MLEWNVRGGNGLKPHKVPRNIDNVLVTMDPGVDQRIEWGAGEFRPREEGWSIAVIEMKFVER
jgi:hypothetical protein